MSDSIITANDLAGGLVVFLTEAGGWSSHLADARLIGPDALPAALAYAKAQHDARVVVEPYAIEVTLENGAPVPVRLRERIRAAGPTIAYGAAEIAERAAASETR